MKKIISILVLLTSLNCVKDTPFEPKPLHFIEIGKGKLYGAGGENISQSNHVITNTTDWQSLMNQMDSNNNIVTDSFEETNIDFTIYFVIAVFDAIHGNGGWSIDILSIVEMEDLIGIEVTNLETGNGLSYVTQPYHIVKIPKSSKPFVFD